MQAWAEIVLHSLKGLGVLFFVFFLFLFFSILSTNSAAALSFRALWVEFSLWLGNN